MSIAKKEMQTIISMSDKIIALSAQIKEMQTVIDGAVREGVYTKANFWWLELRRLSSTPQPYDDAGRNHILNNLQIGADEILLIPASRKMDSLIKSFVMGGLPPVGYDILWDYIPHYSTDISAAWQVWNKLVEEERYPTLHEGVDGNGEHRIWISLANPVMDCRGEDDLPLVICRAALLARGTQ